MMQKDARMDKRIIAVILDSDSAREIAEKILDSLCKLGDSNADIILFKHPSVQFSLKDDGSLCKSIDFPSDRDTMPKQKNFILDYAKSKDFRGFLHIIESSIQIDKDPLPYIQSIENTMDVLDYSVYFSVVTDPCNYVFKKFDPRLSLVIDDEAMKSKLGLPDQIFFTSHSNTAWVIYDFNRIGDAPQKFDERFSIAMYYIVEFLARRKATRNDGQLYYMNQYIGIPDEIGVFHQVQANAGGKDIDNAKMANENAIFKSLNVDVTPDNNIDMVLDQLYTLLKRKLSAN